MNWLKENKHNDFLVPAVKIKRLTSSLSYYPHTPSLMETMPVIIKLHIKTYQLMTMKKNHGHSFLGLNLEINTFESKMQCILPGRNSGYMGGDCHCELV